MKFLYFKILKNIFQRSFSTACKVQTQNSLENINLIGRDLISPQKFTSNEFKSLLWTAMCLKHCTEKGYTLPVYKKLTLTAILDQSCSKMITGLTHAAKITNSSLNIIISKKWHEIFKENKQDYGRMLAATSDIIFVNSVCEDSIKQLADGANVPVVSVECSGLTMIQALADLVSLQTHFKHLKGLKFAWIGLHGPHCNSYLSILPKFGIDINFYCVNAHGDCVSPSVLDTILPETKKYHTEIHECSSLEKAIYRVDAIATSYHQIDKLTITMKHINEAAVKWALLHPLPRGKEIDNKVFQNKNVLAWESFKNMPWIYTAIVIRLLMCYEHNIPAPKFDDIEAGYAKNQC